MQAHLYRWTDISDDNPIALLARKKITTERVLLARIKLEKGCDVAVHHHESEQVAIMLSGRGRWTIGYGDDAEQFETVGGDVLVLPSNVPHGLVVLEDSEILDVVTPPAPMGIDSMVTP